MPTPLLPNPNRRHQVTRVAQSRARELIIAYLAAAKTSTDTSSIFGPVGAALHPNARLTKAGPVAHPSGVGALVLRNLERVGAGLNGEIWEPEPGEKEMDEGRKGEGDLRGEVEAERTEHVAGGVREEWQDKEEFEREQDQDVFLRDDDITGQDVPRIKVMQTQMRVEEVTNITVDKEFRKKLKKERLKQTKRTKMETQQKVASRT